MDLPPDFAPQFNDSYRKVLEGGPVTYVFAKDVTATGHKRFSKEFVDPAQALSYQNTRREAERNFYEVMLPERPVKLFYDIDICPAIENEQLLDAIIHEIIEVSILALKEMYNITSLTSDDFALLDSSGVVEKPTGLVNKTSIHIILARKVCFRSVNFMKKFVSAVFSEQSGYIKDKSDLHVDHGVYRFGCLRMPGSTKLGQRRYLKVMNRPTTNFTELDCMITNINANHFEIIGNPVRHDGNTKRKEEQLMKIMQARLNSRQFTDDDIFKQVVDALPIELAVDYNSWIAVGIKLYTAGASESFWHDFSRKSVNQYNYTVAHEKWESFKQYGQSTVSGLLRLLRNNGRADIANQMLRHTLRYMGKYNHEIGMGLARLYGDDHVFSSGIWYFFDGFHWIEDTEQTHISRTIMTKFQSRLDHEIQECSRFLEQHSPEHPAYHEENARCKNLYAIKEKTQSGRIGSDWHVLQVAFEDRTFASLLDSNLDLIGFENGVYDLSEGRFRSATRDDRISCTVGYNYVEPYDEQVLADTEILNALLSQLFPDPNVHEYMLCFLGSCLSGRVNEELIHFWTGLSTKQTGSNGKSTFVTLLLQTFGQYASCGHASIITNRRESSNCANSALMALKTKRLVTFQEIDNENSINMSVIKGLTGNDVVTGRQLYKSQETFLPQWKLVVCANKLPSVSSDDGGTRRRLRNVPFESKFVDDPRDPKWVGMCNVFRIDYHLKSKLDKLRIPFIHKLLEAYHRYIQMGELPSCAKIDAHTDAYFKKQNTIYQFLCETLEEQDQGQILIKDLLIRMNANGRCSGGGHNEEDVLETLRDYFPTAKVGTNERGHTVLLGYIFR